VNALHRFAALDLETRIHIPLARQMLRLDDSVEPAEVGKRLLEKRRNETGSDFQKLPYHEPVASAILWSERAEASPDRPVLATAWRCWRLGETPIEEFVRGFFQDISNRTYVGFNSQGFDLPLMELWASRCRVSAPEHFARPEGAADPRYKYGDRHCDLQKELVNWTYGAGSFDELCKFHGLPGKPGVKGDEVETLVAQGRLDEVHAYNLTDVVQTHLLFLHVLLRAGRLTRAAASESARSALSLTRRSVLGGLSGAAGELLARSVEACERSPLASAV
jgi:predicted PolB exonuclease-like 3'-5' exonuclease